MEERSCDNCRLKRRGECFGAKSVCQDYKYAPTMTEEQAKAWPKEMRYRTNYSSGGVSDYLSTPQFTSPSPVVKKKKNPEVKLYVVNDINLYEFIKNHRQDVVLFGCGRNKGKDKGYYQVAIVSKMHMRYLENYVQGTAERSILEGILRAIQRINRSINIHVFVEQHIGIGNSFGRDWSNADLYKKIEECIIRKRCKVDVYVLSERREQIQELLLKQNREKYFTVLPDGR